jgi:hypothetical protein
MEHGSLKRGLLTIPKREVHGNTIYDATSTLSLTVYFDAIRRVFKLKLILPRFKDISNQQDIQECA